MEKYFIIAIVLLTSFGMYSQDDGLEETDSQKRMTTFSDAKRHELSLDVVEILAFPTFNPRYEYVLNKNSGIGAEISILLDDDNDADIIGTYSFTPFYRQYFFSKEDYGAKGFYGEGFLKFYGYDDQVRNPTTLAFEDESFFEIAAGFGIGWKWVSSSGFSIDINLGLGRNLGIADDDDIVDDFNDRNFTTRGGVNFGWRF